jgi:hypothetical protein
MTGYLYQGNPWLEEVNARIMAARESGSALPRRDQTDGKAPDGVIRHGTAAGYKAHRRYGEQACPACLEAERNRQRARASGMSASEAAKARWSRIRGRSDS